MTSRLPQLLLLLFLLALPAAGQGPDASSFLLDGVVVEGVRSDAGRDIVTAEARLVPGRQYTEDEIRLAVYRVRRLPFVLHADYSLRDGQEGGGRRVVFEIEANHPFFVEAEGNAARRNGAEEDDDQTEWSLAAEAGVRMFVGGQGLLTGSISGFDEIGPDSVLAAYTRYGLFGRGAKAQASVRTNFDRDEGDVYDGQLSLEVPIAGDHSLRGGLGWFKSKRDDSDFVSESESRRADLAWIFETTDDPRFTTRGTFATAGLHYGDAEQSFRASDFSDDDESSGFGALVEARRYWPVSLRTSLSADLLASWDRNELDGFDGNQESTFAALGVGHAFDILGTGTARRGLDLRWENHLHLAESRFESPFGTQRSTDASFTTGLAVRAGWGLARLSFTYLDNVDQDFEDSGPL